MIQRARLVRVCGSYCRERFYRRARACVDMGAHMGQYRGDYGGACVPLWARAGGIVPGYIVARAVSHRRACASGAAMPENPIKSMVCACFLMPIRGHKMKPMGVLCTTFALRCSTSVLVCLKKWQLHFYARPLPPPLKKMDLFLF